MLRKKGFPRRIFKMMRSDFMNRQVDWRELSPIFWLNANALPNPNAGPSSPSLVQYRHITSSFLTITRPLIPTVNLVRLDSSPPSQLSIYKHELSAPGLTSIPLLQPYPHMFDSAPVRAVHVAIGSLLGRGYKDGKGSVYFGN
jgi:hypothetical protein